mmetsp:Transcript_10922/g.23302  ORF Transcript_10922/g.23302 Transcript_10922/m.23302 type:complete len:230 (-) Transcript_10922:84-773(-)
MFNRPTVCTAQKYGCSNSVAITPAFRTAPHSRAKRSSKHLLLGLLDQAVLLADAEESVVGAGEADLVERIELLHLVGDNHRLLLGEGRGHGHDRADLLHGLLELGRLGVAVLRLVALAWEDDQLALVLLEALRVDLQRLSGTVPPAVVHGNTECARLLLVKTSLLQLSERETLPLSQLVVVLDSRRVDHWAQKASSGARGNSRGLGAASQTPPLLARGLIKPGLHVILP